MKLVSLLSLVVVVSGDVYVKNPHYEYCLSVEEGGWAWWLAGCAVYGSAGPAAAVGTALVLAAGVAGLVRLVRGTGA